MIMYPGRRLTNDEIRETIAEMTEVFLSSIEVRDIPMINSADLLAAQKLEKVINTSDEKPTPSQAKEILTRCGILNHEGEIEPAYAEILTKRQSAS